MAILVSGRVANAKLFQGFEVAGPSGTKSVVVGKYYNSDAKLNDVLNQHGLPESNGLEEPVLIGPTGYIRASDSRYGGRSPEGWDAHLRFFECPPFGNQDLTPGLLVHTAAGEEFIVLNDVQRINIGTFTAAGEPARFEGLPTNYAYLSDPWA